MTDPLDEIRALIREVIREVLPKGLPVTETVNLSTDEDLAVFVARLLDLDPQTREDVRAGRMRFTLAATVRPLQAPRSPEPPRSPRSPEPLQPLRPLQPQALHGSAGQTAVNGSAGAPVRRVERGAVTEKTIREAARAGERLVLGPGAVLTPLARDRARASGVEITKER